MLRALKAIADNGNRGSLASSCRRRRVEWFRDLIRSLPRPLSILDVGGTEPFWQSTGLIDEDGIDVTLLNLTAVPCDNPKLRSIAGDACDLSCFGDDAFDIVFSNSVIEHVGDADAQRRMASELRRVGRRYFIQTPNRWFPIEPHFLVPGFQFMPVSMRVWLATHFNLGWYRKFDDRDAAEAEVRSIQLLSRRTMRSFFPDAEIHTERVFGAPKSFVAVSGFAPDDGQPD